MSSERGPIVWASGTTTPRATRNVLHLKKFFTKKKDQYSGLMSSFFIILVPLFLFSLLSRALLLLHTTSDIVGRMSEEQRQSERIAQFLVRTGKFIALNTQNAAEWTGKYVAKKGEQYRAGMEPGAEPVNISPAIRHGVFVLHKGSKLVGKVTRFLLEKIGDVGIAVGQRLADSLGGGGRAFRNTATVLGGGITAVSTVWIALEDATKTLMRNMANETVQTVQLRYGDEASQTAHHTLYALGHTTLAGFRLFQLYELGTRSIAGRMARKAGLQLVHGVSGVQQQHIERVVWRTTETYTGDETVARTQT